MIHNPAEARAMGKTGREQSAQYDLHRVLFLYEDLYRRAAGRELPEKSPCITVS